MQSIHRVAFGPNINVIVGYLLQENNNCRPITHLIFTGASNYTSLREHPTIDLAGFTNLKQVDIEGRVPVSCLANFRFLQNGIITLVIDHLVLDSNTTPFQSPVPKAAFAPVPTESTQNAPGLQGVSVVCKKMDCFSTGLRLLSNQEQISFLIRNLTFSKPTNTSNINQALHQQDAETFASLTGVSRIGHSKHNGIELLAINVVVEGVSNDIEFVESDLECQLHYAKLFAWMINAKKSVIQSHTTQTIGVSHISTFDIATVKIYKEHRAEIKFIECELALDKSITTLEEITEPSLTLIVSPQNIQDTFTDLNRDFYDQLKTKNARTLFLQRCSLASLVFFPAKYNTLILKQSKIFEIEDTDDNCQLNINTLAMIECAVHFQETATFFPNATSVLLSNCTFGHSNAGEQKKTMRRFRHMTLHATSDESVTQILYILQHLVAMKAKIQNLHINIPSTNNTCLFQSPNIKRSLLAAAQQITDGAFVFV